VALEVFVIVAALVFAILFSMPGMQLRKERTRAEKNHIAALRRSSRQIVIGCRQKHWF
jgi:hypothetical protein